MTRTTSVGREPAPAPGIEDRIAARLGTGPGCGPLGPELSAEARRACFATVAAACVDYLADRAVLPGSRSGEVAARLERVREAAGSLLEAMHALDGPGLGLLDRALADESAAQPGPTHPGGASELLACLGRLPGPLTRAAEEAWREPRTSPAHARLRLGIGAARALAGAGLPLPPEAPEPLRTVIRAAFAEVGVAPEEATDTLIERAAAVARRRA